MSLKSKIENKSVKDFSRKELENLAKEHQIQFKESNKDATIFNKLVKKSKQTTELVEVRFLLSPTGRYNLAYNVGDIGLLAKNLANEVVEDKYAEFVK